MAAAETTSGYIEHHLQNLQVCSTDQGIVWNIQEGIASDVCKGNFWALNVDTLGMSLLLGFFFTRRFLVLSWPTKSRLVILYVHFKEHQIQGQDFLVKQESRDFEEKDLVYLTLYFPYMLPASLSWWQPWTAHTGDEPRTHSRIGLHPWPVRQCWDCGCPCRSARGSGGPGSSPGWAAFGRKLDRGREKRFFFISKC